MSDTQAGSLLDELDDRQNQVLRDLDQLNAKIERLIEQWRPAQANAENQPAADAA